MRIGRLARSTQPSGQPPISRVHDAAVLPRVVQRTEASHVRPGGRLVAACCTSRIEREVFHKTVAEALGADFSREREIPAEVDHPVGFPQADYLKIAWWKRAS